MPGRDRLRNERCSTASSARPASIHPEHQVGVGRPLRAHGARPPARPDRRCRGCRRCRAASPDSRRDRDAPRSRRAWCPAIGDTIAASRRAIRLSRVDLPAFGGPAIATTRPSRSRSPRAAPASASAISSRSSRAIVERRRRPDPPARRPRRKNRSAPRPAPAPRSAAARQVSARSPSRPLSCAERLPALRLGLGADQVGQALDRGQIELAVLERAAGELARLRRPQALDPRRARPAPRRSPRGRRAIAARPMSSPVSLFGPGNHSASASSIDLAASRIAHARERRPCAAPARGRSAP